MIIHWSPITFADFFHVFSCATWERASTHNFQPHTSPGLKQENHSKVCVLPWHCHQKLLLAFHAFPKLFFLSMKINLMQRFCSFKSAFRKLWISLYIHNNKTAMQRGNCKTHLTETKGSDNTGLPNGNKLYSLPFFSSFSNKFSLQRSASISCPLCVLQTTLIS